MTTKLITCLLAIVCLFSPDHLSSIENTSTVVYPVGELGEKWQFPSDHLPVGLTVGNVHLVSWNVLNTRYIYHIVTNQQGLRDSLIVTANIPVELNSHLTLRERLIVDQVLAMIQHPARPRSLIALQEVGPVFFEALKKKLPQHMACVTTSPDGLEAGDIFIYDTDRFAWVDFRSGHYQIRPRNTYMTLTLQDIETGLIYHFVQSHVPAAPGVSSPARREFAQEILSHFDPDSITVVMGDMNRSPDYLLKDFADAAAGMGMKRQPLRNLWVPYATHIDTQKNASWLDNLFFHNPFPELKMEVERDPGAFFASFDSAAALLNSFRPFPLHVSFEIWCKVKARGVTVVYGAPGSGKSEQMALALKNEKAFTLDLRKEFLEFYFHAHEIEDPAARKRLRQEYPRDAALQKEEYDWLNNRSLEIVESLLSSEAELIVFDEFDLIQNDEISPHKLSTFLTLSSMAKRVVQSGKKVVFIVHDAALDSPIFWEELSDQFGLSCQDVVKTGFLEPEEEKFLLGLTGLNAEEQQFYREWTKGMPAAYLALIEFAATGPGEEETLSCSLEELMNNSITRVEKNWKVVLKTQSREIIDALLEIAEGGIITEDSFPADLHEKLVNTGMVKKHQGGFVMPFLAQETLANIPSKKFLSLL